MTMRTLALPLVLLAACTGPATTYVPFDPTEVDAARAEQAHQVAIADLVEPATLETAATLFGEAITRYEAELKAEIAARGDAHLATEGWGLEDAGATLDAEWAHAAAVGRDASRGQDLSRAQELVDKVLHVAFHQAIYDGLASRTRTGLDAAYGLVGLDDDGAASVGLVKVAAGRETEFSVEILPGLRDGFLAARDALADGTTGDEALGDDPAFDAAIADVDRALLRTLGLYASHELAEVRTEPDVADIKLAEARAVWEAVAPYAAATDPAAADAILAGMYPDGGPERSSAGYLLSGLDEVLDGTTIVDAASVIATIETVLPQ